MLLALLIIVSYLYSDWLRPIKNSSVDIAAPFYWIADLHSKAATWTDNRLMSRERLTQENQSLRTEVLVLRSRLQAMASLEAENLRLRALMNAADRIDERVLIAELVGVSPDPLQHRVIINRGSDHGVFLGQALLDANGLMGQVVTVGKQYSHVLLITDATHALPVQLERNSLRFIMEGVGNLDEMYLRFVANTADIKEGDLLVSSGLGQRFPFGFPVGTVTRVEANPGERFARVTVAPKAQLNRSRYVLLTFKRPEQVPDLSEQE